MVNSDIVMFRQEPAGNFVCEDKWATAPQPPVSDTTMPQGLYSVRSWNARRSGGILYARFVRGANASDPFDLELPNDRGQIMLACSRSSNADTAQHTDRGIFILSAGSTVGPSVSRGSLGGVSLVGAHFSPAQPPGTIVAHAFLMLAAFPVVMVVASLFVPLAGKAATWWFPAHWILNSIATTLALIAAALAVATVAARDGAHFSTQSATNGAHQIIGLLVLIALGVQMCLGIIAHFTWPGPGSPTRTWPDRVHHWFGRGLLLMAAINVFLGIWAIGWGTVSFVLYAVYLALVAVALLVVWWRSRRDVPVEDVKYQKMQAL